MGMFGQAKDLYKMQKEAKKIKKDLAKLHIEAEVEGVIVTINGEQEVVEVKIPEDKKNHPKLEQYLLQAFNKAIKKSQQIAADRMKDVMDQMGLNMPAPGGK